MGAKKGKELGIGIEDGEGGLLREETLKEMDRDGIKGGIG